jgi:hypothetical protein
MKIQSIVLFLTLVINLPTLTIAQDGRYWSESYGNKSVLLNGAVNASVSDLGTVFYNPGRLGLIENPAFVINAKVYELSSLKIEDGINEGVDVKQSNITGGPSLAAGTFRIPALKNHRFAYSFLTRQKTKADFFISVEDEGDLIDAIPGEELVNGNVNFNNSFSEEWIGLTWSHPISDKLSLGLSNFVSLINKSSYVGLDMKALDERNKVASLDMTRKFGFKSYGLLWKMGVATNFSLVNLGVTITTPRINLSGKGSTLFGDYLVNVDSTGDGNTDDVYIYNIQRDVKAQYKTPWAIGFGVGINFKKAILHLSAEWFDKVNEYSILETVPFNAQSTGDTLSFTVVDEMKPVFNYGIGLEWHFNKMISGFVSFATDYSGVTSGITRFAELDFETTNSVFQADFFKTGGGVSLNTKKIDITIGVVYTGASQQIERPINFPDEGNDPIFDSGLKSNLKFRQWRFILGFSFPFAEKNEQESKSETQN